MSDIVDEGYVEDLKIYIEHLEDQNKDLKGLLQDVWTLSISDNLYDYEGIVKAISQKTGPFAPEFVGGSKGLPMYVPVEQRDKALQKARVYEDTLEEIAAVGCTWGTSGDTCLIRCLDELCLPCQAINGLKLGEK